MFHHGIAPIIAALPAAATIAQEAAVGSTDWATYASQLGVGGVLVAFAVWLQDRMTKQRAEELRIERLAHEATRAALIASLTSQIPKD